MFFIPYGDENPTKRFPYITYMFIVLNAILFFGLAYSSLYRDIIMNFAFIPDKSIPYTYFTSAFLHADIWHLLGNMLFLFIAGDNVEDKLGHIGFFVFYMIAAGVSNLFHCLMVSPLFTSVPTIGASGAISAVLGAYILLFPKNKIKFFYLIIIIFYIRWGTFKLASFWAIGLWFFMQLFSHASTEGYVPVAYGAHIGGFIYGAVIVGLLVLTGILKSHWHKEMDYNDVYKGENIAYIEPSKGFKQY